MNNQKETALDVTHARPLILERTEVAITSCSKRIAFVSL